MISNRAKSIKPALTMEISAKVKKLKAQGEDIIGLSIGEPDFFTPRGAKNGGIYAINNNITKYDIATGNLELKKAICEKLKKENNLEYTPEQIVVSNGSKQAEANAILSIIDPGDEVLIPVPSWVSYPEMVNIALGKSVFIPTTIENNFVPTIELVEKYITDKTKMIILNNPNNPTGSVMSKDQLFELCTYLTKKNIIIMSDEVYESMTYDQEYVSIASLSEEIYNNTITINGFSKSYSMTGWRLGYSATPLPIAKAIGAIQSNLSSHPSTVSMQAGIFALKNCDEDLLLMVREYKQRRDHVAKYFQEEIKVPFAKPQGAFYLFFSIKEFAHKLEGESKSMTFCNEILDKYKVALVPGIGFGDDNYVRMSYATDLNTIDRGMEKIKEYINTLR